MPTATNKKGKKASKKACFQGFWGMFSRVLGDRVRMCAKQYANWFAKARILAFLPQKQGMGAYKMTQIVYSCMHQALFFMRACLVRRVSCFRASSLVRIRARECMHL